MNQQYYRSLIVGQTKGWQASFLRLLLAVSAQFYRPVIALRNLLYDRGVLKSHRVNAPVISIGNITAGGTGKTPLVIWLCRLLGEEGMPCAILTRGYKTAQNSKARIQDCVDEPAIIAENCPQAAVVINPDRLAGAAAAIKNLGAKVLIMDDGFQHRRLVRDLDIVTIDATCPFGHGRLLPAGLLREPVGSLKRAHAVVITRCDHIEDADLKQLTELLKEVNPEMMVATSVHRPVCIRTAQGNDIKPDELKGSKVFAFCGIGNPDAFLGTLKALGLNVVGSRTYNDHHHYGGGDIADLCGQAKRLHAELVLTTEKDWTKISRVLGDAKELTFACLAVELKLLTGQEQLIGLIRDTLAGKIP
ncbi:MAG: tetraacyldisaccharide 4'-kinase [Planctomycetota bacterium]